jgi:hypothetical protein
MSFEMLFTKESLLFYLKELAREIDKEFRKPIERKPPVEIVLIGDAAILINYGFRKVAYGIDTIIPDYSVIKNAVDYTGNRFGLPANWIKLDMTFRDTGALLEASVFYKTSAVALTIRTIAAEHLIAMKLISGRQYKNDFADIVGILWEHQKRGNPISRETIDKAVAVLYGENAEIPAAARKTLDDTFAKGDFERVYNEVRKAEREAKGVLVDFGEAYPDKLKGENIDGILEQARQKRRKDESGCDER